MDTAELYLCYDSLNKIYYTMKKKLSSLNLHDSFIVNLRDLEKNLANILLSKGIFPKKKLKVYLKNLNGIVIGDDFFKIALCYTVAHKILVSH